MAGEITFTIPVNFASLSSPVPMSYLDQCFSAIQTALSGVAISAAGVTANSQGTYEVRGLTATNNSGTPATQYDIAADLVGLRDPSTGAIVASASFSGTCNLLTAGPAANGRDQAGAFSASSWVHFYVIWNGSGGPAIATLASATAPPTGPTLPNGYAYWAYVGAVRFDSGSALLRTTMRGQRAYYAGQQVVLSNGHTTTETAVSVAALVPPNAGSWMAEARLHTHNAGDSIALRYLSGFDFYTDIPFSSAFLGDDFSWIEFPNVSQQFYYLTSGGATVAVSLWVQGYTMANGA